MTGSKLRAVMVSGDIASSSCFEAMALGFVDRPASHDPSWAWVPASDDRPLAPSVGFLRSASILVPPPVSSDDRSPALSDDGLADEFIDEDDTAALRAPSCTHRLELHIVYSETYRVPVLLLQGYGDDGRPWRVEAVRVHLGRCARAGPASLPREMVSQARALPRTPRTPRARKPGPSVAASCSLWPACARAFDVRLACVRVYVRACVRTYVGRA